MFKWRRHRWFKFWRSSPRNNAFDLPLLFEDVEAKDRFQNLHHEKPKNAMKRRGLQALMLWHNGMENRCQQTNLLSILKTRKV
ncbi:hypothetical protein O9929_05270 [Vibrio lentus]|nr:hypothetical protein [Vibrio lentus]